MTRRTSFIVALLFAALTWIAPGDAHAIPIPCTSGKIVKVMELPESIQREGKQLHLGYLFSGCLGDKFVLWSGSGREYYSLPPETAESLLQFGLQPPGFWSAAWNNKSDFWVEWLWLSVVGLFGCIAINNKLRYGTFAHPNVIAQREAAAAAKAAETAPQSAPTTVTARRLPRSLAPSSAAGSVPSFGRR